MKLTNMSIKEMRANSEKYNLEMDEFCLRECGIPIPTDEERKIIRKKLLKEITEEYKDKRPIDSKKLLKEVKEIIKLLENDNKILG